MCHDNIILVYLQVVARESIDRWRTGNNQKKRRQLVQDHKKTHTWPRERNTYKAELYDPINLNRNDLLSMLIIIYVRSSEVVTERPSYRTDHWYHHHSHAPVFFLVQSLKKRTLTLHGPLATLPDTQSSRVPDTPYPRILQLASCWGRFLGLKKRRLRRPGSVRPVP